MPQRRKPSDMRLMPIEEQQEVQQRLTNRRDVSDAISRLIAALLEMIGGDEATFKAFIAAFQTRGHQGQYHESPSATTKRRTDAANVKARLRETPLNWMGAIELSYVLRRIEQMIATFAIIPQGSLTLKDILQLYEDVGDDIRQKVYTETGHWPEEFPAPRDRITGDEPDNLFKPTDYQPKLFEE